MALTQKQEGWATTIEDWSSSGLTQAHYCQQNNINLKEFSNWKYRLDKKRKQSSEDGALPVTVKEPSRSRRP